MKYFFIFFLLMFLYKPLLSQVGINTQSPLANLDLKSINDNSDGLTIPIVNNFSEDSPSIDQNSMLVYYDNNSNGYKGFYWWDNENQTWQYIFQSKMIDMNLFKIIARTTSIEYIPPGNSFSNIWYKSTLAVLESPNANYKIIDGELIIGRSGLYSVNFNGEVGKTMGSTSATWTDVGIFINYSTGMEPSFISSTTLPSADNGDRYTTHSISNIQFFNKGDRISIRTRRTTDVPTSFSFSKNYILILSYI